MQVSNIVGRAELLSCVFFLLSILSYYWAIYKGVTLHTRWPLVMLSILFAGTALFSKEQGITSIGVYLLLDVLLCWDIVWSKILMWVRGKSGITDDVIFRRHMHRIGKYDNDGIDFIIIILVFSLGTSLLAAAALLYVRLIMNHGVQPMFKPIDLRASFHEDKLVRYGDT